MPTPEFNVVHLQQELVVVSRVTLDEAKAWLDNNYADVREDVKADYSSLTWWVHDVPTYQIQAYKYNAEELALMLLKAVTIEEYTHICKLLNITVTTIQGKVYKPITIRDVRDAILALEVD